MKIEEFAKKVFSDETLKKECLDAFKSGKLLEFAKENGCEATVDEIKDLFKKNKELKDDDLDNVSGGNDCHNDPLMPGPSIDEIKNLLKGNKELSDDDLDNVAGGNDCDPTKIVSFNKDVASVDIAGPNDFLSSLK
jgi:predicted ribosomally synthesized peptide with nif11-like leader